MLAGWTTQNAEGHVIIETIDITSMRTNGHTTMERKAHYTAIQEHAMEDKEIHIFKGIMGKKRDQHIGGTLRP